MFDAQSQHLNTFSPAAFAGEIVSFFLLSKEQVLLEQTCDSTKDLLVEQECAEEEEYNYFIC